MNVRSVPLALTHQVTKPVFYASDMIRMTVTYELRVAEKYQPFNDIPKFRVEVIIN